MPFGVLDFIHSDGLDWPQRTMLQTLVRRRIERRHAPCPRGPKRPGGILPRKFARPAGEEQHIGFRQLMLPSPTGPPPRTRYGSGGTRTRRIEYSFQKDEGVPRTEWNSKLPLRKIIVAGRRLVSGLCANSCRSLAGPHRDLDCLFVRTEAGMMVKRTRENGGSGLES